MPLKDIFNDNVNAQKTNDSVLRVYNGTWGCSYDFKQRIVLTTNGSIAPFSQMDREVLVAMRDKLIEMGGHPPELPPEAPAAAAPARKFSL